MSAMGRNPTVVTDLSPLRAGAALRSVVGAIAEQPDTTGLSPALRSALYL